MKAIILSVILALLTVGTVSAQTLQVDPIFGGSTVSFEIANGTPGAEVVVCYSLVGSGPFVRGSGLILDLSLPIRQLAPITLDQLGGGILGPLAVPSGTYVGQAVWFQAVQIDLFSNPAMTTTNLVLAYVANNPPVANDDNAQTTIGVPVIIDVVANDTDYEDSSFLPVTSVGMALYGSAVLTGNNMVQYTPFPGYFGADSFTYTIQDSFGITSSANVAVTVN